MKKKVAVVVLNFNGLRYLDNLFKSLKKQSLKIFKDFDVYFSDNCSYDESLDYVRIFYPKVNIYKNNKNLWFAGGNNIVFRDIYKKYEYVVMLNNDVYVDQNWLEELIKVADSDKSIGVVGSKLVFFYPYLRVILKSQLIDKSLIGDSRNLSFKINYIQVNYNTYDKIIYRSGFYPKEYEDGDPFMWLEGESIIDVPFKKKKNNFLHLSLKGSEYIKKQKVSIYIGQDHVSDIVLNTNNFKDFRIKLSEDIIARNSFWVINNAGSNYDELTGSGEDIGFKMPDAPVYNKTKRVKSVCGASMLIRTEVFDNVGFLDDYFDMYYEDTDFCWRVNRTRKWKIFYAPKSVVRHIHTGSSKEWSPLFIFYVERNRLLMLCNNAPISVSLSNLVKYVKESTRFIFSSDHPILQKYLKVKILVSLFINVSRIYVGKLFI